MSPRTTTGDEKASVAVSLLPVTVISTGGCWTDWPLLSRVRLRAMDFTRLENWP